MITIHVRHAFKWVFILSLFSSLSLGCSKEEEPETEPVEAGSAPYNKLITVSNFGEALPAGSEPLDNLSPIYFSLENRTAAPVEYRKTNRWDLSFSSTYRSFMGGNNGTDKNNFGADGPGKGGILILEKNFDEVIDIPADNLFKSGSALIGTDDAGAFGQGLGYYIYDFDGRIQGDGSYDKQHVAYVFQSNRTIVVRTAKGNYAKIKMLSIYKDLLDPATWKRDSPHPFFSFQYVLAVAGSKKFEIK